MASPPPISSIKSNQQKFTSLSLGPLCKCIAVSGLILFFFYVFLLSPPNYHPPDFLDTIKQKWLTTTSTSPFIIPHPPSLNPNTNISHIVFGIVGSMNTWKFKRHYSESWWKPNITRGYVFLDRAPGDDFLPWSKNSPPFRVNEDISKFPVYPRILWRAQVRIFRTILETFREGDKNVRWYVMADDDTVLFVENLVEVLRKYDHTKYYYIGSNSECVRSNYYFAFGMAFGGAGYALSYPLAALLATKLDGCIERYPYLRVSDHMLYSCLTDLGFSITHEKGFHQIDLRKDISGFLSSHPQSPILSLHHIDIIDPIFPGMSRPDAINHLMKAAKVDSPRLVQQTMCYHKPTNWTISISWGYSVHIYENIMSRTYLKKPLETFIPWSRARAPMYMFDTRWVTNNPCEAPHVFFFNSIEKIGDNHIVTTYVRKWPRNLPACSYTGNFSADPISKIQVFSPGTPPLQTGGIECCDVGISDTNSTEVNYRACLTGEVIA